MIQTSPPIFQLSVPQTLQSYFQKRLLRTLLLRRKKLPCRLLPRQRRLSSPPPPFFRKKRRAQRHRLRPPPTTPSPPPPSPTKLPQHQASPRMSPTSRRPLLSPLRRPLMTTRPPRRPKQLPRSTRSSIRRRPPLPLDPLPPPLRTPPHQPRTRPCSLFRFTRKLPFSKPRSRSPRSRTQCLVRSRPNRQPRKHLSSRCSPCSSSRAAPHLTCRALR
mmetsp:Transcript_33634/g.60160  ORF Transcript_33634/g.60160 Transcript_33634/m.60160 type:complete len:217 (-) Transcript_33634:151-801(-)